MLCLNCHQAREVESETPGVRKYARCPCGAISIISELDFARREFGLSAGTAGTAGGEARPVSEWGSACQRGFVRDERFGGGQVIKGTNRATSRKWRKDKQA